MAATITQISKPLHPRALDTSGNNNHGTAYTGQALEFDGVSDEITMTDVTVGMTNFTLSLWYLKTVGASGVTFTAYHSGGTYIKWGSATTLTTYIDTVDTAVNMTITLPDDGNWHHYVATVTPTTSAVYIDGVVQDTTSASYGALEDPITRIGSYNGGSFFDGKMSNYQIWDKAWTASDVSYAYLNPEKLALSNSGTSLSYSNLKLWYPMQDTTRGTQINLMDGANTGLGEELVDNSAWTTASVSTAGFIEDTPGTWTVHTTGDLSFIIQAGITLASTDSYKLTYTITNSTGSGTAAQLKLSGGNSAFATQNIDGNDGTHTVYLLSGANSGKTNLQFHENGFVGTISNISLKSINLKNHGTSVFYGEELWANDEALLSTDYGSELADLSDFSSTVGVTVDGSTIVFDADTSSGAQTKLSPISYNMGSYYKVTYTISGYSGSGSFRISVGNNLGTSRTANGTYTDVLLRSAGGDSTYFYASNTLTCVLSSLSIVEVGSASELRTGSEIASGALSYGKWYEITDQGSSADLLAKGNPIDDNSDWTAQTGWAADAGNAKLTASGTTGLIYTDCTTSFANGDYLTITYTVTNVSGGTVRFIIGGNTNGTARDANGTYTESVTVASKANDTLYFDGVSTFTGEISAITVTKSVDFTLFGAPDNNIGTKFLVSHADGSSVPTMDSDNKAWLLDLGWGGYAGNTYSIALEDDALRVKITQGSTVTNGLYIYFNSAKTEFGTAFAVGREYKFTCKLKVSSGDDVNAQLYDGASATNLGTYDNTTFGTVNVTFTAHNATNAYFKLQSLSAGDEVWISDFSIIEQGFATGWTEADAQPTIPQLGFQSFNQLGMFNKIDTVVDINADTTLASGTYSFWAMSDMSTANGQNVVFGHGGYQIGSFAMNWSTNMPIVRTGDNQYVFFDDNAAQDDGKWHHWVVYLDHSTITNSKLYVDGVLQSHNTTSATGSIIAWGEGLNIGADKASPSYLFDGCITEFSWWNKELSLAEAQELYNDGEALDATLHSSAANLSGYWRNEGGSTWTDLSTNSNNGTPTSITENLILPEGQNGRDTQGFLMNRERVGVNLDGVSAFVGDLGMGDAYGSAAMSIGCWFKCEDVSSSTIQFIWGGGHYSLPNKYGFGLGILSSNLRGTAGNNSTSVWDNLNYSISSDTWYHAVLVYDKDNGDTNDHFYRLYVDGVLRDSYDTDNTPRFSDTHESYLIGCSGDHDTSPNYGSFFKGSIDDVTLYSTALEAPQVLRNYKAGKGRHRN